MEGAADSAEFSTLASDGELFQSLCKHLVVLNPVKI